VGTRGPTESSDIQRKIAMTAIHEESSKFRMVKQMGWGVCAQEVSASRERYFVKNILKKVWVRTRLHRRTLGSQATLSLATPQRELREAKQDGIEWKDGMYDVEQSSRRNKSIIINANQRTCVRRFRPEH
jgi:hypothetical protein